MKMMERRAIFLMTNAVIQMCPTDGDLKAVIAALKKELNKRRVARSKKQK
jgi:hypothetical protein